jgi:hypothetical protein
MLGAIYSGQTYLGQSSTVLTYSLAPDNGIQAQIAQGTRAIIMWHLTVGGTAHQHSANSPALRYVLVFRPNPSIQSHSVEDTYAYIIERKIAANWHDNNTKLVGTWTSSENMAASEWQKSLEKQSAYWRDSFGD